MKSQANLTHRRENMVRTQLESRGVSDELVLSAMRTVPREEFVPENLRDFAYEDTPLPIEQGQTISQPFIVALMLEALALKPSDRVLEIGAGSGYAASVISRMVAEVYAVERHEVLAELARGRANKLGYNNLHISQGDGTSGWREHAPYDAIVVAAGGPDIPPSLIEQLHIGGRLVIPVGSDLRTQELVKARKVSESEVVRESLGQVRFVPLIGSEGWAVDGTPVKNRRAAKPLQVKFDSRSRLSAAIAGRCEPFEDIAEADLAPLLDRIGDARVVLIGEASHGTSEFYRMRSRITRELITQRGFNVVAIEGDYPDVTTVDRHVRARPPRQLRTQPFSRFPTWMWRNTETLEFVDWLTSHNLESSGAMVSMHGLDLYSLNNSIGAVLDYLDRVDPAAATAARVRYGCFSPWEQDPATYGRAAISGKTRTCETEAVGVLTNLLRKHLDYLASNGDEFFDAERDAAVIRDAERYYRVMYYGNRESWNLRDQHMFDTLQAILNHRGQSSRAVVWAHNSHVGNAAATEMGVRGEFNIGQLVREFYGDRSYSIGFGTDRGLVAAASNWDEPMQRMKVRPSHIDSYEHLCHQSHVSRFLLPLREGGELRESLLEPHLERAIGVIYRPETELLSHYFQAALPAQFDEYIWFDETTAVNPLPTREEAGVPETYPFGL